MSWLGNSTMNWPAATALIVLVGALAIAVGVPVWASVIKKRPKLFGRDNPRVEIAKARAKCNCDCHKEDK